MSLNIVYDAVCDVGLVRHNNEDMIYVAGKIVRDDKAAGACTTESSPVAFAVADGMGGYEGGEVASEIAIRSFSAFMKTFVPDDDKDLSSIKNWAKDTNRIIIESASLNPPLNEMGSTFVALIFTPSRCYLVNIGDSRCYRVRGGILKQLTTDHSERERTGNADIPSNLIYNFLGNNPDDFISDVTVLTCLPDDVYILCSDGLSDLVQNDEIEQEYTHIDALVKAAKDAGGRDNISVISLTV